MDAEYHNVFFDGDNDHMRGRVVGEDAWRFHYHRGLMCRVLVGSGTEQRVASADWMSVMQAEMIGERWADLCCQSCETGLWYSDLGRSSHREKYRLWVSPPLRSGAGRDP